MSQFQDQIDSFAKSAGRFVSWWDTPHGHELAAAFKPNALKELSTIYVAGFSIPDVEFVDAPEFPHVDNEARKAIAINLQSLPFQYYWVVFNPADLEGDRSPNCGDLFDGFQDI